MIQININQYVKFVVYLLSLLYFNQKYLAVE